MTLGTNGNACAELVADPSLEPEVVVDAVPAPVEATPEVAETGAVVEEAIAEEPVIVALDKALPSL